MTNHFNDISYYRNLDPLILYGDTWLYGAGLPTNNIGIPKNVYVLHEKNYNIISWENSASVDMKGYYVYRSSTVGHTDIKTLAIITNKDINGRTQTCYIDYLLDSEVNTQFYYAISSLNSANFPSLHSNWAADMLIDNSFTQTKYLYTDQLTQSYWSIIDLYKQLGNIDTDRNIVPFRDKGFTYTQEMVTGEAPSLYLQGQVAIELGHLNPEGEIQQGYVYSKNIETPLTPKNIATKVNCNYLYVTPLNNIEPKNYTLYMDDVAIASNTSSQTITATIFENDDNENLSNLSVDKFKFSGQVTGTGVYDFYWNSIYNYWQYELEEVNLEDFGISYEGTPQEHNVISVDFSLIGYVYFRVPYIYNSKVLKTYILEEGSTNKLNEVSFKTYNHLIFASTFGKIFNGIQINLRESKGNLYVSDVSDPFVYKNFASYFDFKQPAWMGNVNYRNCVLGNQETNTAGLWQAGMNGGTQLGMKQIVSALSNGTAIFEPLTETDYFTAYNNYFELTGEGLNLPEIKEYDSSQSYDVDDIILYHNNFYRVLVSGVISDEMEFSSTTSSNVECVNNIYKNILFRKSYDAESDPADPLVVTNITDTETVTHNVNDLIHLNDHYYEVRNSIVAFYNLIGLSNTTLSTAGVSNGSFYFNTYENKLYKLENGDWELAASDLIPNAIYLDQSTGKLYQYDDDEYATVNTLVPQTSLRSIDNLCNMLKFGAVPIKLNAIYQLKGTEYYLIYLETPMNEKEYIFKDVYEEDLDTDPISYTHNYILNTYQITFDTWEMPVTNEKYLVYGNKVKLNNQNLIYPSPTFEVYADENMTQLISSSLYTIDSRTGYLIWDYEEDRPQNGSYIWLNYRVDIKPDVKKLIELVKFPQVNIRYVWKEKEEDED